MNIKNVRISFPNIFRPRENEDGSKKYSVGVIIPKDHPQLDAIKAELKRVRAEKWGDKKVNPKVCLTDGSEKEQYDGYDDTVVFFNASNNARPTVVDKDRTPLVEDDGRPYAGCFCNVIVDFWAQDNQYGKRINASLGGVQFAADGEPFGGGGVASADDFDTVEEEDDFLAA